MPTNFPSGVSSYGVPILGSGDRIPTSTGKYWFVHSGSGSNSNTGKSPASPLATIDAAVNLCTASRNDVIVVMPGHAETIAAASSLVLDVAGITIVGLGEGRNRPVLTFATATTASITVSAANITIDNLVMIANLDNVAAAITLGATSTDFKLLNCEFIDNSSALHFLTIVVTGTGNLDTSGLKVQGCSWWALALAPNAFISILGDCDRLVVADNYVTMAATDDEGHFITITADTLLHARILRNVLVCTGSTGAAVGIFLTGSSTDNTGIVAYNLVSSLDTTAELIATAGTGLSFFENYYTGTADASGKLWPVVDAA